MARIHIENGWLDVRVSLLERVLLREKPHRVPLSKVKSVNPHPALLDMLLRWTDQSGVWLAGATPYEGYLVPASRNPSNTLAIQIEGQDFLYVELDDEDTETMAARIECARRELDVCDAAREQTIAARVSTREQAIAAPSPPAREPEADDPEEDSVHLRDPLMQGSLAPPPPRLGPLKREYHLDNDRDLTRLGGWLVVLGGFGVLTGATIVAAGLLPGLLAVGAGLACGAIGGLALALVAHHQG